MMKTEIFIGRSETAMHFKLYMLEGVAKVL